jgi:hypothetical protein
MRRDMARHDAIAQRIVAACDGALVRSRGEGDSLFAVFARATNAIQAAVAIAEGCSARRLCWAVIAASTASVALMNAAQNASPTVLKT